MRLDGENYAPSPIRFAGFACDRLVSMFLYGSIVQFIDSSFTPSLLYLLGAASVFAAICFLVIVVAVQKRLRQRPHGRHCLLACGCFTTFGFILVLEILERNIGTNGEASLFFIGCLTLSIGSAGLFLSWGRAFSHLTASSILLEMSGGFLCALLALPLVNLSPSGIRLVLISIACIGDVAALYWNRLHTSKPINPTAIEAAPQILSAPNASRTKKKLYLGLGCYGAAMGLLAGLLPFGTEAVYAQGDLNQVLQSLADPLLFGGISALVFCLGKRPLVTAYRASYLAVALSSAALLLYGAAPLLLSVANIGQLLIIATCMSLLFAFAGVFSESSLSIIAAGVAIFLGSDLAVRLIHDGIAATPFLPTEAVAFGSPIALIAIITLSYSALFTEKDVEEITHFLNGPVESPTASSVHNAPEDSSPSRAEKSAADLGDEYGLTAREQEVLTLLLDGRSSPRIQAELFISESTVRTHIRHIYAKMNVRSRQELIDLRDK